MHPCRATCRPPSPPQRNWQHAIGGCGCGSGRRGACSGGGSAGRPRPAAPPAPAGPGQRKCHHRRNRDAASQEGGCGEVGRRRRCRRPATANGAALHQPAHPFSTSCRSRWPCASWRSPTTSSATLPRRAAPLTRPPARVRAAAGRPSCLGDASPACHSAAAPHPAILDQHHAMLIPRHMAGPPVSLHCPATPHSECQPACW